MKLGYADPPYIGCAHLYRRHPDYAGEVDHRALIQRLQAEFDGWVLHASATDYSIAELAPLVVGLGEAVVHWACELMGAHPSDTLVDLFPGTGAVARAWEIWKGKFTLPCFDPTLEEK